MRKRIYFLGLVFIMQSNILFVQAVYPQLDESITHKKEWPFYDKNLSKEKIKKLIIHYWPDRKNIIEIHIYKTDCNDDWVIRYHQNIPQMKFTNRKICYVFKKDTTYYKVENLIFYCDYLGGDQYGEIHTSYSEDIINVVNNNNYKS